MKAKKKFDAVKMMREIRDRLSKEMMGMSFQEQKEYIRKQLSSDRHDKKQVQQSGRPAAGDLEPGRMGG